MPDDYDGDGAPPSGPGGRRRAPEPDQPRRRRRSLDDDGGLSVSDLVERHTASRTDLPAPGRRRAADESRHAAPEPPRVKRGGIEDLGAAMQGRRAAAEQADTPPARHGRRHAPEGPPRSSDAPPRRRQHPDGPRAGDPAAPQPPHHPAEPTGPRRASHPADAGESFPAESGGPRRASYAADAGESFPREPTGPRRGSYPVDAGESFSAESGGSRRGSYAGESFPAESGGPRRAPHPADAGEPFPAEPGPSRRASSPDESGRPADLGGAQRKPRPTERGGRRPSIPAEPGGPQRASIPADVVRQATGAHRIPDAGLDFDQFVPAEPPPRRPRTPEPTQLGDLHEDDRPSRHYPVPPRHEPFPRDRPEPAHPDDHFPLDREPRRLPEVAGEPFPAARRPADPAADAPPQDAPRPTRRPRPPHGDPLAALPPARRPSGQHPLPTPGEPFESDVAGRHQPSGRHPLPPPAEPEARRQPTGQHPLPPHGGPEIRRQPTGEHPLSSQGEPEIRRQPTGQHPLPPHGGPEVRRQPTGEHPLASHGEPEVRRQPTGEHPLASHGEPEVRRQPTGQHPLPPHGEPEARRQPTGEHALPPHADPAARRQPTGQHPLAPEGRRQPTGQVPLPHGERQPTGQHPLPPPGMEPAPGRPHPRGDADAPRRHPSGPLAVPPGGPDFDGQQPPGRFPDAPQPSGHFPVDRPDFDGPQPSNRFPDAPQPSGRFPVDRPDFDGPQPSNRFPDAPQPSGRFPVDRPDLDGPQPSGRFPAPGRAQQPSGRFPIPGDAQAPGRPPGDVFPDDRPPFPEAPQPSGRFPVDPAGGDIVSRLDGDAKPHIPRQQPPGQSSMPSHPEETQKVGLTPPPGVTPAEAVGLTTEMEPIGEATQKRRRVDETLARFSKVHDELKAEERAKRAKRRLPWNAEDAELEEQLEELAKPPGAEAQDEDKPKPKKRGLFSRVFAGTTAILVFVGTGVGWGFLKHTGDSIDKVRALDPDSASIQNAEAQTGDENFLLIGSDTREGAKANDGVGDANEVPGARADTTMIAHVPKDRSRVVIVSFPRDLEIARPDCERFDARTNEYTGESVPGAQFAKLNTAYEVGGPLCATKVVQEISGLRITRFIGIDFHGFKDMVDAVDGVSVCVEEPMYDTFMKKWIVKQAGKAVELRGDQALDFVRARHVRGDPTSDYGRIKRQQRFLSSLLRKSMSGQVLLDPGKLTGFTEAFTKSTFGDNITVESLFGLGQSLQGLEAGRVTFLTVPTVGLPNDRGNEELRVEDTSALFRAIVNNQSLPGEKPAPRSDTDEEQRALPQSSPLRARQQQVDPKTLKVQVLNGGNPTGGMARDTGAKLAEHGYQIVMVNSAPKVPRTVIYFGTGNEAAARTLASSIPGVELKADASMGNALVLVLGPDFDGEVVPPGTAEVAEPKPEKLPEDLSAINGGDVACA